MYISLKFQSFYFLDFGVSCVVNLIIKRKRESGRSEREGGREEGMGEGQGINK